MGAARNLSQKLSSIFFCRTEIVRGQEFWCPLLCRIKYGVLKYYAHLKRDAVLNIERELSAVFYIEIFVGAEICQGRVARLRWCSVLSGWDSRPLDTRLTRICGRGVDSSFFAVTSYRCLSLSPTLHTVESVR